MKTVKTMESSMPLKRRRLLGGLLCLTLLFTLPSACAAEPESIDVTPVQAYVRQRFAEKMAADGAEAYRIEYSNLYVSPHDPDTYFCEFGYSLDGGAVQRYAYRLRTDGGEIRVKAEGEQLQMTDN